MHLFGSSNTEDSCPYKEIKKESSFSIIVVIIYVFGMRETQKVGSHFSANSFVAVARLTIKNVQL